MPIDELEGRITTSLVTPYPPGIPLLIPGEVFNRRIVDYLKFNREFARECPGFETDRITSYNVCYTKLLRRAREKILDAAKQLVMTKGFSGMSVDDILHAADVSKGAFFHHFKSKAVLGNELVRWHAHKRNNFV